MSKEHTMQWLAVISMHYILHLTSNRLASSDIY